MKDGRYWVNAPSTLQPPHSMHGTLGILAGEKFYPREGAVHSMCADSLYKWLSPGWPEHLLHKDEPSKWDRMAEAAAEDYHNDRET